VNTTVITQTKSVENIYHLRRYYMCALQRHEIPHSPSNSMAKAITKACLSVSLFKHIEALDLPFRHYTAFSPFFC